VLKHFQLAFNRQVAIAGTMPFSGKLHLTLCLYLAHLACRSGPSLPMDKRASSLRKAARSLSALIYKTGKSRAVGCWRYKFVLSLFAACALYHCNANPVRDGVSNVLRRFLKLQ